MGIKIDTLPPALRAQVEAKLRAEDKRRLESSPANAHRIAQDASGCAQTRPETSGRDTRAAARKRQPNKTEARYAAEMLRGLDARYEAVTFRLSNGHRYTPDWVVFDSAGRLLSCHDYVEYIKRANASTKKRRPSKGPANNTKGEARCARREENHE